MKLLAHFFRKRYSLKQLKRPILLLLILEVVVIGAWSSSKGFGPRAMRGYLVKDGPKFVVFWLNDQNEQGMMVLENLQSALSFAHNNLDLEVAESALPPHPLESLWVKASVYDYAIYWKTLDSVYVNRLTFHSKEEARVYQEFLKKGAYSPSPIGHSLALLPIKKN